MAEVREDSTAIKADDQSESVDASAQVEADVTNREDEEDGLIADMTRVGEVHIANRETGGKVKRHNPAE